ncbi:hypothetical protein, partial [Spirochaeta lutea]|uniref:hypothetical protein n=1 Tax=Spirochaeta lutea TaxID=1480694 RepID=UPI001EE741B2
RPVGSDDANASERSVARFFCPEPLRTKKDWEGLPTKQKIETRSPRGLSEGQTAVGEPTEWVMSNSA